MKNPVIDLNRSAFRIASVLIIILTIGGGCYPYRKVPVVYRRSPVIEQLDSRSLTIGTFYQKSAGFQAVTDMIQILQRKFEKDKVFKNVQFILDVKQVPEEQESLTESMAALEATDWSTVHAGTDLLLTGAVLYIARDRSGYDSEWQINRYGYRVPKKVYRDRLSFELELNLLLVEPGSGQILIRETYEDKGVAEGSADEIAVFYDLIEKQLTKFLDTLRGKEIKSKQYLLYR